MERRRIGSLDVSVVGIGCNNFGMRIDAERTAEVVSAALDRGINYFDTAESYGAGQSEVFLGAALGSRRDEAVIASKWAFPAVEGEEDRPATAGVIRAALDGSLQRLGTDRIDHYQLHRPAEGVPVGEVLATLADLHAEGKVREVGCSNFSAVQLDEAVAVADELGVGPFVSVQNHYSLLTRAPEHDGVLDACRRHGIAFVPYFPLESGVLTGKYRPGEPPPEGTRLAAWGERAGRFSSPEHMAAVTALLGWLEGRGPTLLELAMSWLVANDTVVSVISGATSAEQVQANADAVGWQLSPDELAEVDEVLHSVEAGS